MTPAPPVILDDPPGTALGMKLSGRVVLTRVRGIPYLWDVLDAGPLGLIVGDEPSDLPTLLAHLDLSGDGFAYLGPRLDYLLLTPCERRVLRMIAFGLTNAEMAARLGRKVSTVNTQVAAVLAKLGVPNRYAARDLYWGNSSIPGLNHYG